MPDIANLRSLQSTVLVPNWPAPAHVHCLVTTQEIGNLGLNVGDDPAKVKQKRLLLQGQLGPDVTLQWLQQTHGTKVVKLSEEDLETLPVADAIWTNVKNKACGVLTADCLPVFFCDREGREVAVAHAGWRGLQAGILENTVSSFGAAAKDVLVWLGPAIGPCHFEVGEEVKAAFFNASSNSNSTEVLAAFTPSKNKGKWMADLFQLARLRLTEVGVKRIYGGGLCTFCSDNDFYSYRRDKNLGRFASVIWQT